MESRLEKIFSMAINCMSLAVWLGEDRKCFAAVVGSDLASGLSMVRRCSLKNVGWDRSGSVNQFFLFFIYLLVIFCRAAPSTLQNLQTKVWKIRNIN